MLEVSICFYKVSKFDVFESYLYVHSAVNFGFSLDPAPPKKNKTLYDTKMSLQIKITVFLPFLCASCTATSGSLFGLQVTDYYNYRLLYKYRLLQVLTVTSTDYYITSSTLASRYHGSVA